MNPSLEVDRVAGSELAEAGEPTERGAAFVRLADRQLDASYRLARAILRDPAEAEDAVHDAFVQAWRKWSTLRDPARFEAWFTLSVLPWRSEPGVGPFETVLASMESGRLENLRGLDLKVTRWLDDQTLLAQRWDENAERHRYYSVPVDRPGNGTEDDPANGWLSPDSSMVARIECAEPEDGECQLLVVDVATGSSRSVASGPDLGKVQSIGRTPVLWAPDSGSLAFTMFRIVEICPTCRVLETAGDGVWIVNADGSGLDQLSQQSLFPESWQPVWR